jgi:hypothetical protein
MTLPLLMMHEEFLGKKSVTEIDRPPYSPDLARCNLRLFTKLKRNAMKGQQFVDIPVTANAM